MILAHCGKQTKSIPVQNSDRTVGHSPFGMPIDKAVQMGRNEGGKLQSASAEQFEEIAARLSSLVERAEAAFPDVGALVAKGRRASPKIPVSTLEEIFRQRQIRNSVFADYADMFGEPAWDILLDTAIMEQKGKPQLVTSACIGSGAPATTALRYIRALEERRLIHSENDAFDARKRYLKLTPKGWQLLKRFLTTVWDESAALLRM